MSQIEPQQQQALPKRDPADATNPPIRVGSHIRYLARRETHSSRAVISVFVALIVIIALVYLIVESVLSMLGHAPLLMRPSKMVDHVVAMGASYERFIPYSLIIAGVIIALVGLFLLFKAFLPGTLRRHVIKSERMAIVVDDGVIAAGVSRSLRHHLQLESGQVTTSVRRREIEPNITPTSGRPVDAGEIKRHTEVLIDHWKLQPSLKVKPSINDSGVVGR